MKKIEAVIRPTKLEELKKVLNDMEVRGLTVYNVMGRGLQQDIKHYYRGQEVSIDLFAKVKVEIVCPDHWLERIIDAIITTCRTGAIGMAKSLFIPWKKLSASALENGAMQPCRNTGRVEPAVRIIACKEG